MRITLEFAELDCCIPQPFGEPINLDQDGVALLQQLADIRAASGKSR